jgi:hypothetical protein
MKFAPTLFSLFYFSLLAALAGVVDRPPGHSPALIGSESVPHAVAQDADKLVYADFQTVKENRPVSSRGGLVQLFAYQERPTMPSHFKGLQGANPPAPEFVSLKKDDPNRAIAFEYELQSPNDYAGVGVEIHAQEDKDGKPTALDASAYKFLALQLYVTGVQTIRIEFITRGNGINITSGPMATTFKVKPGFNTYQVPLKSLTQPPWAEVRASPKDVLKRLTSVNVVANCDQCSPVKGTVVIDNLVFQN